jgi:drug/metabolite transporter (DMT)-like permease
LMTTVQPVVVIALGLTFLSEAFSLVSAAGAGIVLAGVVLAQFATPSEPKPAVLSRP